MTSPREPIRDLDSLPLPAFDLLPGMSHYGGSQFIEFEQRPTFRLVTSRGCPFNCWFCARSVFGNRYRTHSGEYVIRMVRVLYEKYGVRHIYFSDDTLTVNKARLKQFCERLRQEGWDLTWDCNARVDTVDLSLLKAMERAGCKYIAYGIESGNQEILDKLHKGINLEQIRRACEWTRQVGIKIRGNFMIANPGETEKTMQETVSLAKSLPLDTFKMSFFTPFPGTEFYQQINQWGEYKEDWSKLSKYSPVFIPRGLSLAVVENYYKKAYLAFYFRPKMIWSYISGIKSWEQMKVAMGNFITLSKFIYSKTWNKLSLPLGRWKGAKPLFTLGVTVVTLGVIFSRVHWEEVAKAMKMVDTRILFLCVLVSIGHNIFGVTDKWKRILEVLGFRLPYRGLLAARVGSYAIRGLLPLKTGEVSRVAYIKKFYQVPFRVGGVSVAIGVVLNIVTLLFILGLGWLLGRK